MDTDGSYNNERKDEEMACSGQGRSYFRGKHVILTYGLLGLSHVLILALFITVLTRSSISGASEISSMNELNNMKNNVTELTEKMSKFETSRKKSGPSCDSEWLKVSGSCYYFTITKLNWRKSRFLCFSKGSDLAVVNNEMEQKFLSSKTKGECYWIGLSDKEKKGVWSWVDGTDYKTSYKFWKKGQPNDFGKKGDCAHLWINGEWNNHHCTDGQCYAICEMKQ